MNTSGQAPAKKSDSCLARQPILTQDEKVIGYELLFRESPEDNRFSSNVDTATCSVIDTLNVMGLEAVCDGRLGFINCTREMLLKEFFLLLPPDKIVIEIQESVVVDDCIVSACQRLKQSSYSLALDNFEPGDPRESLVPYADFLKIDIRKYLPDQNTALAAKYSSTHCRILARRAETR